MTVTLASRLPEFDATVSPYLTRRLRTEAEALADIAARDVAENDWRCPMGGSCYRAECRTGCSAHPRNQGNTSGGTCNVES